MNTMGPALVRARGYATEDKHALTNESETEEQETQVKRNIDTNIDKRK